jgi:hypothetical protein
VDRIAIKGASMRSPLVRQETSPSVNKRNPLDQGQRVMSETDLNWTPKETMDDSIGQENGDDLVGQEDGDDPVGQEDGDADDPLGEGNARKNLLVSNEKRREIFEALFGRARIRHLKGSETRAMTIQFSIPIRTVQRIWKRAKVV